MASFGACRAQMSSGLLDAPDSMRKTHGAPTPTSGGVGIAIGFAAGLIFLSLFSYIMRSQITPIGAGMLSLSSAFAYAFLAIGFLDDATPLDPRMKAVVFSVCALGAAAVTGPVRIFDFGFGWVLDIGFAAGLAGTALWVFTMVNCVNFMDGVNGLSMGSVAIALAGLGLVGLVDGSPATAVMSFVGAGALLGFLYWNFPRGRLFAGDSGALFAGAISASASLMAIHRAGFSPFAAAIVFLPLLADALLTLVFRARRGRSLLDGHSEHIYQIALRAGWPHLRVTLAYWGATLFCVVVAVLVTRFDNSPAPWLALTALAGAAFVFSTLVRRFALARGIAED